MILMVIVWWWYKKTGETRGCDLSAAAAAALPTADNVQQQ